mgnify:CR=1 FL=1
MWGLGMIEVVYIKAKGQVRRDLQTVRKLVKQATTEAEARQARQAFFNQWRIWRRLPTLARIMRESRPGGGVR